jgi:glycosyltransferase involved in cell wall biosynthesis
LITPLKLLEALSMGNIVLGSDVGGIKEVIKNGANGYLYEKDNPKSFRDTLIKALESENTKISKNARQTVLKEYNWDNSARKLKDLYDHMNH